MASLYDKLSDFFDLLAILTNKSDFAINCISSSWAAIETIPVAMINAKYPGKKIGDSGG